MNAFIEYRDSYEDVSIIELNLLSSRLSHNKTAAGHCKMPTCWSFALQKITQRTFLRITCF